MSKDETDEEVSARYEAFSATVCKIKRKNPNFDIEKAEAWFNS